MSFNITEDYAALMDKERSGRKFQNNLRASSLGIPCDRRHYYSLTEAQEPPSQKLMSIFRLGNWIEKMGIEMLREMGYIVNDEQKEFRLEKPLIMCHIDGMLKKDGPFSPFDIKSMNQFDAAKMTTAEDFLLSKKAHQRNYPVQLLTYMYATNSEYGYLIIIDKQTGWPTVVVFSFDAHVQYLDAALKMADRVYQARDTKTPPERTEDIDLCLQCPYRKKCLPDLKTASNVKLIENEEIPEKIGRILELKEFVKEHDSLDDEIKKMFTDAGPGEYVSGDFLIRVKEAKKAAYTVKESTYLTTKFVKMS